jgi:hypothetical protein
MTKDTRLSIRMTADLDAWLDAEACSRGLDKAAFARMVLFERMNGRVAAPVAGPHEPAAGPDAGEHVWMELQDDTIDIESIVAQRVAEALARQQPQSYAEGDTGMTAHRRGSLPLNGGTPGGGIATRVQRHAVFGA